MEQEDNSQTSKYNDAGLSVSRLHENWLRCNSYIRKGSFKGWKYELDIIWLELYPDVLRTLEKKEILEENDKILIQISSSKTRNELFFNLMQRHSFLRKVQDLAGKAGVYVDENEEGFE